MQIEVGNYEFLSDLGTNDPIEDTIYAPEESSAFNLRASLVIVSLISLVLSSIIA
jgi:hypothetical protein